MMNDDLTLQIYLRLIAHLLIIDKSKHFISFTFHRGQGVAILRSGSKVGSHL